MLLQFPSMFLSFFLGRCGIYPSIRPVMLSQIQCETARGRLTDGRTDSSAFFLVFQTCHKNLFPSLSLSSIRLKRYQAWTAHSGCRRLASFVSQYSEWGERSRSLARILCEFPSQTFSCSDGENIPIPKGKWRHRVRETERQKRDCASQ